MYICLFVSCIFVVCSFKAQSPVKVSAFGPGRLLEGLFVLSMVS